MNEMAMVEYLLRLYAKYDEWSDLQSWQGYDFAVAYAEDKRLIKEIIQDRFGMTFRETDTEYIAENGVCSVRVRKEP